MAAYTTTQAGNWSSASTWGGSGPPGPGDTATVNNAVTVDVNTTVGVNGSTSLAINAALTVAPGVTLTLRGNAVQADVVFALSAGSGLVFDCTSGDVKWLFGTAANFTNYTTASFRAAGTSGSHATVSKTGANSCWFDDFGEGSGSGAGKTGYDCTYCDFTGIGKADGSFSLGLDDFGSLNQRLSHCTFTSCATVFVARPYTWSGSSNKDYYIRDCAFSSSTGATYCCEIKADGSSGTGAHDVTRNSFDKSVNCNAKLDFVDNYFAHGAFYGGTPLSNVGNLYRVGSGDGDQYCGCSVSDAYWLAAPDHPGNPHCLNNPPDGSTVSGCVFEYPNANAVDSGECVYLSGPGATVTVTGNLAVPSETDGYAIGNIAHHARSSGTQQWAVTKNTCVGTHCAFAAYSELGSDPGSPIYSAVKSNLVVDPSTSLAAVVQEVNAATNTWDDLVLGGNATNNGKYGPASFTDPATSNSYPGYVARFTSAPGTGDVTGDPGFVDSTRNFGNWAVHKGAASSGDTLATRTAAAIGLVSADPSLIRSDLIPWVRAGFAPTNSAFATSGHDGGVIGAVAYASAGTTYTSSLSGSLASSGSLARRPARSLAGSLAASATLARRAARALSGTLTSSGSFSRARAVLVSLSGSLAASGSLAKRAGKALAGSLAASGSTVARSVARALAGSLAASAAFSATRAILRSFAASLSASGSLARSTARTFSGSLAASGSLRRSIARALAGSIAASASFVKSVVGVVLDTSRHPDPGRSTGSRRGPDPGRSTGSRN